MTCEDTRARLLELPPDELLALPHLTTCDACRALAEALATRHGDLDRALDQSPDLPTTLGRPQPANTPWRWTMSSIALATAVAATLALGLQTAWIPTPDLDGAQTEHASDGVPDPDAEPSSAAQPPAPEPLPAVSPGPLGRDSDPAPAPMSSPAPRSGAPDPTPLPDRAAPVGVPAPTDGICDLVQLETLALLGKLSPDDVDCLEDVFDADPRSSANRMLIVNWYSAGQIQNWEDRALLQMDADREADAIDPDLAYKLALHFSKKGDAAQTVVLAEEALGRRTAWTGATYTARVNSLFKLRAAARQQEWQAAETAGENVRPARAAALAAAREWLEFARASGKDETNALTLCRSAATTPDQCD